VPAPNSASEPTRAAAGGLVQQADVALSEGRLADAQDLLERAVAVDPRFAGSYVHLARLHLAQGEEQLALAFLDKAEALTGDRGSAGEIATLRGAALEGLGDRDAARRAYERALSLTPHDGRARAGLVRTGGQPR
jgi:tetratricopeptide (TPR) repeat protein